MSATDEGALIAEGAESLRKSLSGSVEKDGGIVGGDAQDRGHVSWCHVLAGKEKDLPVSLIERVHGPRNPFLCLVPFHFEVRPVTPVGDRSDKEVEVRIVPASPVISDEDLRAPDVRNERVCLGVGGDPVDPGRQRAFPGIEGRYRAQDLVDDVLEEVFLVYGRHVPASCPAEVLYVLLDGIEEFLIAEGLAVGGGEGGVGVRAEVCHWCIGLGWPVCYAPNREGFTKPELRPRI